MIEKIDPNWHKERPIVVDACDAETVGLAAELIKDGDVVVRSGLTKAQAMQGAALVRIALREARETADIARTVAEVADEQARAAERRVGKKVEPEPPRSAQDHLAEWDRTGRPPLTHGSGRRYLPRYNPHLRTPQQPTNPPATVSRSDLIGIGRWAKLIAMGVIKVVD
jgi:hypothetical protein